MVRRAAQGTAAPYCSPAGASARLFDHTYLRAPGGSTAGSAWNLGVEAGYDITIRGPLVLRPYVGVGNAHGNMRFCGSYPTTEGCTESGDNDFFFQAGSMADYVGERFLGGIEIRMVVIDDARWIGGGHFGVVF